MIQIKLRAIFLVLSFLTSLSAFADVWKSEREWMLEDETKFSAWIASDAFSKRIFVDVASPYINLPTDCADVIYAARIIFAFENKLHFKSFNPTKQDGNFWKKYITNNTNLFDKYPEGAERVKAYISYLGKFSDTKILAKEDSYPILLKDIKPGDFYITEQDFNGTQIRHTYIVKKVYASGIFDLYYSTLPYMIRELKSHRGLPLFPFAREPFGFRRFKAPFVLDLLEKELPSFSLEQYDLLKKSGPDNILSEISKSIRTEEEGLKGRLDRIVNNLCRSLNDRIEAVDESLRFVDSVKGRCVSRSEYNNLSTPVKDQRIISQIKTLSQYWRAIIKEKKLSEFSAGQIQGMNYLLGMAPQSESEHKKLCAEFSNIPLTIFDFQRLYEEERISSHPNDSRKVRWGEEDKLTDCQKFY